MQVVDGATQGLHEEAVGFPTQYGPTRSDTKPGHPFFPHEVYRDFVAIFLLLAIMFFITAYGVPRLGTSANPFSTALAPPDWYLLWSWGLLKIGEISLLPKGTLPLPGMNLEVNALFYGSALSAVPFVLLILLPFLDKGREARPAKAPMRSAWGIAGIVWVFGASLYSVNAIIISYHPWIDDNMLKWWFLIPPALAWFATYIGLRRLGFQPMRNVMVVLGTVTFLVLLVSTAVAYIVQPLAAGHTWADLGGALTTRPTQYLAFFVTAILVLALVCMRAVFLPERQARALYYRALLGFVGVVVLAAALMYRTDVVSSTYVTRTFINNGHVLVGVPVFLMVSMYVGLRQPYSTYEFLLNECYQCGKCHTVCPVTKVEYEAIGGLNLVYNTFKHQHDGVPLWTCLACDACSAVCPLDIKYSDYILQERSRLMRTPAADGGVPDGSPVLLGPTHLRVFDPHDAADAAKVLEETYGAPEEG